MRDCRNEEGNRTKSELFFSNRASRRPKKRRTLSLICENRNDPEGENESERRRYLPLCNPNSKQNCICLYANFES